MKEIDGRILQLKHRLGNCHQVNQVIEELAQTFNVTPLHLKHLFREQTGRTVFQFDKDLRLQRAKELLETNEHEQVKKICVEVGFNDCSHFVRDFEEKFGISPKELQNKVG